MALNYDGIARVEHTAQSLNFLGHDCKTVFLIFAAVIRRRASTSAYADSRSQQHDARGRTATRPPRDLDLSSLDGNSRTARHFQGQWAKEKPNELPKWLRTLTSSLIRDYCCTVTYREMRLNELVMRLGLVRPVLYRWILSKSLPGY